MFNFKLNQYLKNILTMMSGVILSQIIMVLGSLVLTRLFTPKDFGVIALFLSLVNILTVISTGRYEHAIILPKKEKDGAIIMYATSIIILGFSIVVFFLIFPFINEITNLLKNEEIRYWLIFIPLMVAFNAFFYVFRAWLIRKKDFKRVTQGAVLKSLLINSILIGGGLIKANPLLFLIANLVAQFAETFFLYIKIEKKTSKKYNKIEGFSLLKKYEKFPKYLLPGDLINTYVSQNPIILLNLFFGSTVVGYFTLTQRVLGLPIKLISSTTKEVYKQKATEEFNLKGNCYKTFKDTFIALFLSSLIPTVILFFAAPSLFGFFFGEEWSVSGDYTRYLLIMFCFQFSVSPLSYTLFIRQRQHYDLFWQIGLLIFTSIGMFIGFYFKSADYAIIGFSISYAIMYLVYLKMIYDASK